MLIYYLVSQQYCAFQSEIFFVFFSLHSFRLAKLRPGIKPSLKVYELKYIFCTGTGYGNGIRERDTGYPTQQVHRPTGTQAHRPTGTQAHRSTGKTPKNRTAGITSTPHPNFFFRFSFSATLRATPYNPNSIYN